MPKVFIINKAINQFFWLFRDDFHKAKPFQIKDQAFKAKNSKAYEGLDNNSKIFKVCGSIISLKTIFVYLVPRHSECHRYI